MVCPIGQKSVIPVNRNSSKVDDSAERNSCNSMKYTVYGLVFESNYFFSYFHPCSDLIPADIFVKVTIDSNAVIPYVKILENDWFEISQPDTVVYKYIKKTLYIIAKDDDCIKSTISTVPFFMPVAQKGGVLFHAACVISNSNQKAAIIAAPSGVGKSTIATYLSRRHPDVFRVISDDAIAVYLQKETPYVYYGPTFSKIDAATITLIGAKACEKNRDSGKYIINHENVLSEIKDYMNIGKMKFELGAIFFAVFAPTQENFKIKQLDNRSMMPFIKTSIVATRYNCIDINNTLSNMAMLIGRKIPQYILWYPHNTKSLNVKLCESIHEKISR